MHLSIDVSAQTGARIDAAARQGGIGIGAVIDKLAEQLPAIEAEISPTDKRKAAALAMLESFLAEAPTDPEERRQADAEFEEFKQNLNANRAMAGETPLFP
jgi:hypothetical protein